MKRIIVFLSLLIVVVLGIFLWYQNGLMPVNSQDKSQKFFIVTTGEGLRAIGNSLKKANLIRDPIVFFLEVKKLGLDSKIQAGNYRLSSSMGIDQLIKSMIHGTVDIWVTIPEGDRAEEIAAIFQTKLPTYSSTWLPYLKAREGYLFPDTYLFPKDADINTVITIMTNNFNKKYQLAALNQTASLSQSDVVILASLVQREGKSQDDMGKIASVLENRLNIGMPLQVDATVQYVLGFQPLENSWWKKAVSLNDLQIISAYNTYKNPGLVPTPISNPGAVALSAVLNPPKTNYLYYISDKKGILHFAQTLDQQNINEAKYD